MQASFTDLVGRAVGPAPCLGSIELTDLVPELDTPPVAQGLLALAGQASNRLHHGGVVIGHVSFTIDDQMQSWHIHLLEPQSMPVIIKALVDRHCRTARSFG